MGLKKNLTPLHRLDLLDQPILDLLREYGITTLEEFVGALEADLAGLAELLNMDEVECKETREKALSLLNPETQEAFEKQKTKEYSLGALDPSMRRKNL